jgi:hypothetical protein
MEIELKAKDIHKMGNKYVCYVQVNSIPESIMDWMSTNPREQTEKKKVVKEIKESLINNYNFHELNRGIVESVYKVYHNSSDELRLTFENPEIHGNIDGGHTLKNILNVIKEGEIPDDRYVFMEIFEGIKNRAELAKLAKARNTSMQVDDASIAELEDKFKSIKEVLKKVPFENRIRYKANQHSTEFLNREIISIEKIISILTMYNLDDYKLLDTSTKRLSKSHPIHTYSVKKNCLQKFIKNEDRDLMIKNMQPIIIYLNYMMKLKKLFLTHTIKQVKNMVQKNILNIMMVNVLVNRVFMVKIYLMKFLMG